MTFRALVILLSFIWPSVMLANTWKQVWVCREMSDLCWLRLLYLLPRMTPEFGEIKLPFSSGWNTILDLIQECNFHYLCLMPVSSSTGLGLSDKEGHSQSYKIWGKWNEHEAKLKLTDSTNYVNPCLLSDLWPSLPSWLQTRHPMLLLLREIKHFPAWMWKK